MNELDDLKKYKDLSDWICKAWEITDRLFASVMETDLYAADKCKCIKATSEQ